MEQIHTSELFSLTIDPVTKAHLSETARWAKFLAIVGFVFLALVLVYNVFIFFYMSSKVNNDYSGAASIIESLGMGFLALNLFSAVILFFPLLFLLRFANTSKAALAGNDQQALNLAFQNLKAFFRYWGIITIIALALFSLTFVLTIIGTAVF